MVPSRSPLHGALLELSTGFSDASSQLGLNFLLLFELVRVKNMKHRSLWNTVILTEVCLFACVRVLPEELRCNFMNTAFAPFPLKG